MNSTPVNELIHRSYSNVEAYFSWEWCVSERDIGEEVYLFTRMSAMLVQCRNFLYCLSGCHRSFGASRLNLILTFMLTFCIVSQKRCEGWSLNLAIANRICKVNPNWSKQEVMTLNYKKYFDSLLTEIITVKAIRKMGFIFIHIDHSSRGLNTSWTIFSPFSPKKKTTTFLTCVYFSADRNPFGKSSNVKRKEIAAHMRILLG